MLTADAFGVLPPIARLTPEAAMYHFLSGYTAKVAGTEKGVTEPKATFSTCFGAPFLPLHAEPLREDARRADRAGTRRGCGWSTPAGPAAPYGVGTRMKIAYTRAMIRAALSGRARQRRRTRRIRSSTSTCRPSCPGRAGRGAQAARTWANGAGLRRAGRASWRGCSSRTSRRSRRTSTPDVRRGRAERRSAAHEFTVQALRCVRSRSSGSRSTRSC